MPMPPNPAAEFSWFARLKMLVRHFGDSERIMRWVPERVQRAFTNKAAVPAGSLGELTDYSVMVGGFSASLRTKAVFFRLWDDNAFVRAPLRTRLGLITSNGAVGSAVDEGAAIPLSRVVLETNSVLAVRKAAAMICMTRELAENVGASGQALFSRELQNATASATDAAFLTAVLESDTGSIIASSGTTAEDAMLDLRAALLQVDSHADAKLYWISSPLVAKKAATLHSSGMPVHGAMSPLGGELLGLPCLISDAVEDDELHLIDASAIAADLDTIELSPSGEADVLMFDGTPPMDGTTPTAAQLVSLFQTNSVALRSTFFFGSERLRPNSTATISGVNWS